MKNFARTPKQLGEIIRNIRKQSHLTQKELGQISNIWQETISNIERGADGTKIDTIFTILNALDQELVIIPRRKSSISEIEELF